VLCHKTDIPKGKIKAPGTAYSDGLLSNHSIVEYFQLARKLAPGVPLFLNDFSLLAAYDNIHRNYTTAYVQWLVDQGATVDGLGLQSHFSQAPIDMEEMWNRIQTFSALPIRVRSTHALSHCTRASHTTVQQKLAVTEFDLAVMDQELLADFTRDLMTLIFSADKFDEFLMWGFWEKSHWMPDAAMYTANWTAKPNALAYLDLVYNQWWTRHTHLKTNAQGRVNVEAFKGQLVVEVVLANGTLVASRQIDTGAAPSMNLAAFKLPYAVASADDLSSASTLSSAMTALVSLVSQLL
jgi:hypothetical protein